MKQLRFTTTAPYGFLSPMGKPLVIPEVLEEVIPSEVKGHCAYIHGDAEVLAGFDLPIFLDGEQAQLDAPEAEQDILMMLPSGNYPCIATYTDEVGNTDCYLITLKK